MELATVVDGLKLHGTIPKIRRLPKTEQGKVAKTLLWHFLFFAKKITRVVQKRIKRVGCFLIKFACCGLRVSSNQRSLRFLRHRHSLLSFQCDQSGLLIKHLATNVRTKSCPNIG